MLRYLSFVLMAGLLSACVQNGNESKVVEICDSSGCRQSDRAVDKTDRFAESQKVYQKEPITYRGEDIAELRAQAENGNAESAYLLGLTRLKGLGGQSRHLAKAFTHFEQAAAGGIPEAAYHVGVMSLEGKGTQKDSAKAVRMLHIAADGMDAKALWTLGTLFEKGQFVEKNQSEAFKYFKQAAKMGVPEAAHNVGLMYMAGRGVTADPYQAMVYLRQAAERDVKPAQKSLGFLLAQGLEGFPKDVREARRWLSKAAKNGDKDAANELKYVKAEMDDYTHYNQYLHGERYRLYGSYYQGYYPYRWMILRPYYRIYPSYWYYY